MAKIKFSTGQVVNFDGEPTMADIEEVATQLGIGKTAEPDKKTSFRQKILNAGTAVTNFLGGKGVAETFGAEIAKLKVKPEEKQFITQPSLKETTGSALQLGSTLIPGGGVGTTVAKKVGLSTLTGYLMDVGSNLQEEDKTTAESLIPGSGTAIGFALPVIGTILGKTIKGVPKTLEKANLRLTPNEKRILSTKVDDVVAFNTKNKLIGSPEQRFSKISSIVDDYERKVERKLAGNKTTFMKDQLIKQLESVKNKYTDDLVEAPVVERQIDSIISQMKKVSGDSITANRLNTWKRKLWNGAYSKTNSQVLNDSLFEAGEVFKDNLDRTIPGLKSLNKDYGIALTSKRILNKATSRAQVGLVGKLAESAIGAGVGTAIGGPVGGLVGAGLAPTAVSGLATPVRSTVGVTFKGIDNIISKLPTDKLGNLQIGKKALIDLIKQSQSN